MLLSNFTFFYPCGHERCKFPIQFCDIDHCGYCNKDACKSTHVPEGCQFHCGGYSQDVIQHSVPTWSEEFAIISLCLNCILFLVVVALILWLLRHKIRNLLKRCCVYRRESSTKRQTQNDTNGKKDETSVMMPLDQQPKNDGNAQSEDGNHRQDPINLRRIRTNPTNDQPIQQNQNLSVQTQQDNNTRKETMIISGH